MTDLSRAVWRKVTRSSSGNGGCVEAAENLPGVTPRRLQVPNGAHVVRGSVS
jgi:hypothetical protein